VPDRTPLVGAYRATRWPSLASRRRAYDLVGFIAASVVLVLTALPIDEDNVSRVEAHVFRWFNELPGALFRGIWILMQLGNLLVVPAVVVIAVFLRRFRLATAAALAGSLVWLLAKVVKQIVPRGRPAELLNDVVLHDAPAAGNGYISGHAAVVFALVAVISPYLGRTLQYVAWLLAIVVCLARVYVGAHLPLDVAGGAAFGWAIGSLVNLGLGVPRRRAPRWSKRPT
jgi:membrane-associated phospholipid phosphatase